MTVASVLTQKTSYTRSPTSNNVDTLRLGRRTRAMNATHSPMPKAAMGSNKLTYGKPMVCLLLHAWRKLLQCWLVIIYTQSTINLSNDLGAHPSFSNIQTWLEYHVKFTSDPTLISFNDRRQTSNPLQGRVSTSA